MANEYEEIMEDKNLSMIRGDKISWEVSIPKDVAEYMDDILIEHVSTMFANRAKKRINRLYKQTEVMRQAIDLWMEGYAMTGNSSGAVHLGTFYAYDYEDAVRQLSNQRDVELNRFGKGRHATWACEIFDNEAAARKSFG